jgi:chromosome segregation ATPase
LKDEIDSLNIDLANYNSKVNYWNCLGRAPAYVYAELENERKELNRRMSQIQTEINKLNDKENELSKEAEEYIEKVKEYNKKVDERNAKMDAIHNLFLKNQNDSDEITLGEYDENTNTITIYSFEDIQTLRLVLMHEFGHSLGAKHAQNKNSIMFPILNDVNVDRSNPYPSAEDLKLIGRH